MANYVKNVDFAIKDDLPSGDSGKIIKGSEFEGEFDAISVAIATKADQAGPTFTGTATFGDVSVTGSFTSLGIDDNATSTAVTITSGGDVGIGTSTPIEKANYGTITLSGSSGGALALADDAVEKANITSVLNDLYVQSVGETIFRNGGFTGSDEKMRIDSAGNVGIGTGSNGLAAQFTVDNGGEGTVASLYGSNDGFSRPLQFKSYNPSSASGAGWQFDVGSSQGEFQFKNLSRTIMHLDYDGKVGIGQTSPTSKVDITHAQSEGSYAHLEVNGKNTDENTQIALIGSGTAVHKIVANKDLVFGISSNPADTTSAVTDNVTFAADGNVGIGQTAPSNLLHLKGDPKIRLEDTSPVATSIIDGSSGNLLLRADLNAEQTSTYIGFLIDADDEKMRITSDGELILDDDSKFIQRNQQSATNTFTVLQTDPNRYVRLGLVAPGNARLRMTWTGNSGYNNFVADFTTQFKSAAGANGEDTTAQIQSVYVDNGASEIRNLYFEYVDGQSAYVWVHVVNPAGSNQTFTTHIEGQFTDNTTLTWDAPTVNAANFNASAPAVVPAARYRNGKVAIASADSFNTDFTESLEVAGNIDATGAIRGTDSTGAGTPTFSFGNDPDTGMYNQAADTLGFATGGSEQMRITSTGVGIGNIDAKYSLDTTKSIYSGLSTYTGTNYGDIPGYLYLNGDTGFGIVGATSSTQKFLLSGGTSQVSLLTFSYGFKTQSNGTGADFGITQDTITFKTGPLLPDRMTIAPDGNVGISVGNGDGKGITFGSTTEVAAQTLDYYEEGSWTPELSDADTGGNTATYSTQRGRYTRIGNVVHCSLELSSIDTTGMTGANQLKLQGLPYIAKGDIVMSVPIAYHGSIDLDGSGTTEIYSGLAINFTNSQTYGNFTTNDRTGGGIRLVLVSDLNSGSAIMRGMFTYLTNT